ncbi:MAG: TIGR00159 family protein, partial [Cyclobacteriaceae bacterium]
IRKFLLLIGKSADFKTFEGIRNFFNWRRGPKEESFNITPVMEAVKILGGTNTGALIVFSRDSA